MQTKQIVVMAAVIALAVLAGCGSEEPTAAPTAAPTPAPSGLEMTYDDGFWGQERMVDRAGVEHPFRWTKESGTVQFGPVDDGVEVSFRLQVPVDAFTQSPEVTISVNDMPLETFSAEGADYEKSYLIKAADLRSDAPNRLTFATSATMVPAENDRGSDIRSLGVKVMDLRILPVAAP